MLQENFKQSNWHGIAGLKGEDKEKEQKKYVKNNGQNFPKFNEYYKPTDARKKLKELLSTRNTKPTYCTQRHLELLKIRARENHKSSPRKRTCCVEEQR